MTRDWEKFTLLIILVIVLLASESNCQGLSHLSHNIQAEKSESNREQSSEKLPYHVLNVYGNASLGYYYVNLNFGTPVSQPQTVIVDTGSGILAVPCLECKKCGNNHLNPPYDPAKSSSSRYLTCADNQPICIAKCRDRSPDKNCSFSIHYAEGSSLEGIMVEDDVRFQSFNNNQQIRAVFGCTILETNLFITQKANGIFGLAPRRETDLLEQLIKMHSPYSKQKKQFSICLSSNGGLMTIGGLNKKLHKDNTEPYISIPYSDNKNLYSLNGVHEISIGQTFIFSFTDRFTGYGIFIDSGSTFSYMPSQKYAIVEKELNNTCLLSKRCKIGRGEDSICYKLNLLPGQILTEEVNKLFPPIQFKIMNKKVSWPSTKYMLIREQQKNEVCMGLQPLDRYLLGANWMYDRDIVFDLENKLIHIYENIKCEENSKPMGMYNEVNSNTEIKFTSTVETGWYINTKSTMFVLGIVFLFLAFVFFIFIIANRQDRIKKGVPIRSQEIEESTLKNSYQAAVLKN